MQQSSGHNLVEHTARATSNGNLDHLVRVKILSSSIEWATCLNEESCSFRCEAWEAHFIATPTEASAELTNIRNENENDPTRRHDDNRPTKRATCYR